jgi:hypothetical protein
LAEEAWGGFKVLPTGKILMAQHGPIQGNNSRFNYHLKVTGTVALVVGSLSFATLLLLLVFISDNAGDTYWDVVRSGSVTQQSLGPGMLLAGLFLVSASAAITWLISLYASFRIAGPLFRISRNMEMLIETGAATLTPIRRKDQLQKEMQQLVQSAEVLQNHYREIDAATDNALALIDSGCHDLAPAFEKLRELERRVRL